MKVLSVNISKPTTIVVNGEERQTGFLKKTVEQAIYLGKTGVLHDSVMDRVHHGGEDKACYLYGFNHYNYWEKQYPEVNFDFGMFGENITVDTLDESLLKIGDTFQVGEAIIQITQPRQPCYKIGIKFNDQKIVKLFRLAHSPGIYVRVLQEGWVNKWDELRLIESHKETATVLEIYRLIYARRVDKNDIKKAMNNPFIASRLKEYISKKNSPS